MQIRHIIQILLLIFKATLPAMMEDNSMMEPPEKSKRPHLNCRPIPMAQVTDRAMSTIRVFHMFQVPKYIFPWE